MSEEVKKESKCELHPLKSNFYKGISTKDGLNLICKICSRGYYIKNYEKIIQYIKEHERDGKETDLNPKQI